MNSDKKTTQSNDLSIGDQMRNYFIAKINYSGREIYECRSDHDLDALMFAIYAYVTEVLKVNNLYDLLPTTHANIIPNPSTRTVAKQATPDHDNIPAGQIRPVVRSIGHTKLSSRKNIKSRSLGLRGSGMKSRSLYGR